MSTEREFDKAFGFGSSSSLSVIPETQPDSQVVEGTAADESLAAGAMLGLDNPEGYLSDDIQRYEEEYAQPPTTFSPLSSSSRRSSRSATSASSASSRSSSSSGSADPCLPLNTAELRNLRRKEAATAVINKKRKEAAVVAAAAKKREAREATIITPVAVPESVTKEVTNRRRSSAVGKHLDLEERKDGREKKGKKRNGKSRAAPLSPQFSDVSNTSSDSGAATPITKENRIDRMVVAYIGSKKCLDAASKRTLLSRMIKEPSSVYFSPERGVHLADIFSRNEDSAAKASRWGIPFVSSALFRLSKAIQQEDEDESSRIRQRSAAGKVLRLVHTARHKVMSEIEEKKEKSLREKEKAKKRISSAAGRKHHGLTFDRDKVSLYLVYQFMLFHLTMHFSI